MPVCLASSFAVSNRSDWNPENGQLDWTLSPQKVWVTTIKMLVSACGFSLIFPYTANMLFSQLHSFHVYPVHA